MEKNEEEIKGKKVKICPSLGSCDDPDTARGYPTKQNCCYRVKPVGIVKVDHQAHFCLTADYAKCPAFQKAEGASFPDDLVYHEATLFRGENKNSAKPIVILGTILIVLGLAIWQMFSMGLLHWNVAFPIFTQTTKVAALATPSLANGITPTFTSMPPTPTSTSIPSSTPVPTNTLSAISAITLPGNTLETPIGFETKFIIHRVLDGESFTMLAQRYNTSVGAIKAVNVGAPDILWVDSLMVIPINQTEAAGLPALKPFQVDKDIQVEDLAKELSTELAEFEQLNGLQDGQMLKAGDWVLLPQIVTATP
jgi:hypothetical protein